MKVSREIGIYEKEGEKLIDNFPINNLSVKQLIEILNVDSIDDPLVYKEYDVNKKQYLILCDLIPYLSKYDFDKVFISYECYQI